MKLSIVAICALFLAVLAQVNFATDGCGTTYTYNSTLFIRSNLGTNSNNYALPIVLNSSIINYTTNKEWLCFELYNATGHYPLYYHIDKNDWNTSGNSL